MPKKGEEKEKRAKRLMARMGWQDGEKGERDALTSRRHHLSLELQCILARYERGRMEGGAGGGNGGRLGQERRQEKFDPSKRRTKGCLAGCCDLRVR